MRMCRKPHIRTVLITGPIGSGKSEVRKILAAEGYPVYDCDSRCKALYECVPGLKSEIEQALGIPFSGLSVIFRDEERRRKLEDIVYPELIRDFENWRDAIEDSDVCFIESAIALEKKAFDGLYDEVWMVDAPYGTRVKRNPKAAERSSLQHFDPERIDRTITNDSTIENLKKQIIP